MTLTLAKGSAPPPGPPPWRGHIKPLDGLRGIAILLVMWFHFAWPAKAQGLITKLYVSVAALGWIGVDLFFVLSGFLITGILLDSKTGRGYFRNFYARRVLRIFPFYYAVLLVTLVILPLIVPYDTPALKRLLAGQGWLWLYSTNISVAIEHGNWIATADWLRMGALWSLAVEEHFYLIWPLLVFFLSRRVLLRTSIAIIVLVPMLRTLALFGAVAPDTVYCLTIFRIDALAMGGLLAVLVRDPDLVSRVRARTPLAGWLALAVIVAIGARHRWLDRMGASVQTIGYSALAVMFGAFLLVAVTSPPDSRLHRILGHRTLVFVGKYSYSAYVLHLLLCPLFDRIFPIAAFQSVLHSELAAFVLYAALSMAFTLALAVASYELYEKRFLGLKRFFQYHTAAPTPLPAVEMPAAGQAPAEVA
jgi:peptidoglycan/LPS O-acetylase OafA/YrhL